MKKILILSLLSFIFSLLSAQTRLTAFPGAEGYGKFTTGGRGGVVYHVTRLDDCTDANLVEGTLRWALRTGDDTPRTVVFDTCGTVLLTSKLKLQHPNVTLAGQTAPGGGICIAGACIYVCKPNVIIRYLRFRPGDVLRSNYQCLDVENTRNVIIDHCSLTWAVEECLTLYDCDSTTVQWSIIGEGLYNAGHSKGERSYATQWGGEHGTMHHCLITNCLNRTPRFNGVRAEAKLSEGKHEHDAFVDNEFLNNVVFNWGKPNSVYGGENDTSKNRVNGVPVSYDHIYMVNNYFRCGPAGLAGGKLGTRYFAQGSRSVDLGRWYLSGNHFATSNPFNPDKPFWHDSCLVHVNADNFYGYLDAKSYRAFNLEGAFPRQSTYDRYVLLERYADSEVNVETADEAYASVCLYAGASLPRYDEEDTRLLAEAAGTVDPAFAGPTQPSWLGIIDSQDDITFAAGDTLCVPGDTVLHVYPSLALLPGEACAADTDGDGMPDAWETAHGLNPADPADGAACTLSVLNAGYTNLEYYLNGGDGELSAPIPAARPVPDPSASLLDAVREQHRVFKTLEHGLLYLYTPDRTYTVLGQ